MLEGILSSLGYSVLGTHGVLPFLLLTVLIGGGAAWRTGEAVAQGWGVVWRAVAYTALLAGAVRFLHFSLFGEPLLSLPSYLVDFAILLFVALVGYRARRTRHMTEQYPWVFARSGPLTWRERS